MLLEQRPVSPKTPLDGKLEISPAAAARLAALGTEFPLASAGGTGLGRLQSLACTCAKGAGGSHVHHFVESPLLRALVPGSEVRVELDEERSALSVEPA
jgi:hypothetical protein